MCHSEAKHRRIFIRNRIKYTPEINIVTIMSVFNVVVILPRLLPGVPTGVDTASHLYKVMLSYKSYLHSDGIPFWTPDWYAGTPIGILYSPLSYLLALPVALISSDPILAYKLVESAFYVVTPLTIYFLARELELSRLEATMALLLFSLTPAVIENHVFYDRYPNTIALPLSILSIISLSKILKRPSRRISLLAPSILLALLILTHHLSAVYTVLTIILLAFSQSLSKGGLNRTISSVPLVFLGAVCLSYFWLVPFIRASVYIIDNPFYNRNVYDPVYAGFRYFSTDVEWPVLGVVNFSLAVVGIWLAYQSLIRERGKILPVVFLAILLLGMNTYDLGQRVLGQILIVISFLIALGGLFAIPIYRILRNRRFLSERGRSDFFSSLWFLVFFWLSLGYYAGLPSLFAPFEVIWRTLDIHRFWLYLSVPMSILASKVLAGTAILRSSFRKLPLMLCSLLVVGLFVSGSLKSMNCYAMNSQIPSEIVDYFRDETTYGRVLTIRCPTWIYILPLYAGKPLVDGWYPQGKLIQPLLEINDYRINDLPCQSEEDRVRIWRGLIRDADLLGINWVMIGNSEREYHKKLIDNMRFKEDCTINSVEGNITIYKSIERNELYKIDSRKVQVKLSRISPEHILITFQELDRNATLIIKEAYFLGWSARAEGMPLQVARDSVGYIKLEVPAGTEKIELVQESGKTAPVLTSILLSISYAMVCVLFAKNHSYGIPSSGSSDSQTRRTGRSTHIIETKRQKLSPVPRCFSKPNHDIQSERTQDLSMAATDAWTDNESERTC